jgi:hypothetical protein
MYLGLTDSQLRLVMDRAAILPVEKRDVFLRRIAAHLKLKWKFDDAAVSEAVSAAIIGLIHEVA